MTIEDAGDRKVLRDMKTLGIIGGMGPLAGCDLLKKIIENTQADCDQQHIPVLLDSNTAIPDRTAAILAGGEDPTAQLCASARRLVQAGAEVLAMSCNTAHYFYEAVADSVSVPVLHMPRLTAAYVEDTGLERVALLATDGTLRSGVYQRAFSGRTLLQSEGEDQAAIMSLIYDGVKRGNMGFDTAAVRRTLDRLNAAGAQAYILGCTELPIAFAQFGLPGRVIDPTLILARAAVEHCGGRLKKE